MLPEFPEIQEAIMEKMRAAMSKANVHEVQMAGLDKARYVECFEGHAHGHTEDLERPFREFCETILFKKDEVISLTPERIIEKFSMVGAKLGREKAKLFHQEMQAAASRAGAIKEGGNGADIVEMIFQVMESVHWSFDEHGEPCRMMFFAGAEMKDALVEANEKIEQDRKLSRRKESLIAKKYEEWRAKEADRKLVD